MLKAYLDGVSKNVISQLHRRNNLTKSWRFACFHDMTRRRKVEFCSPIAILPPTKIVLKISGTHDVRAAEDWLTQTI